MHENNMITFQLATHILSRNALRFEYLFKTISEACTESHEIIHRFALKSIIEVCELVEKPEIKSRFLKELIRIEHVLTKTDLVKHPEIIEYLSRQIQILSNLPGLFGGDIHDDAFLKTLRQIHHPHTKECEFNTPQLVLWFNSAPEVRQRVMKQWLSALDDLNQTVSLYLSLLRTTCNYQNVVAQQGFYQHALSAKSVTHLILLKFDTTVQMVPKLQLGHHNLTIRLYDALGCNEIRDKSVTMEIACSQI